MEFSTINTIITGGSSGIGFALARLLTSCGANVCILARDPVKLDQALAEMEILRQSPRQVLEAFPVDAADPVRVEEIIQKEVAQSGPPDLVINAAGDIEVGYYNQLTPADFQRNIANNYLSSVYVTRAVLPFMIAKKSGHVVYISSVLGRVGVIGYSAYGASKAALDNFAEAIRMEAKPCGIHISVVYPSDTDTPQYAYENQHIPGEMEYLKSIFTSRLNTPQAVAEAILRGVAQNRQVIFPDLDGKILDFLLRIVGRRATNILGMIINLGYRRKPEHKRNPVCHSMEGD